MERLCKNCLWWGWLRQTDPMPAVAVCAEKTRRNAEKSIPFPVKTESDAGCNDDFEPSAQVRGAG